MEKTLPLNVKHMETVQKLKVMIQDEVGIPLDQQLLIFCGKPLKDYQLLSACGIIKDSTVYVMMNPLAELLIYVHMACDNTFSLEVKAGYTISDVKVIVESLRGIPASQIKVFRDGVELQDSSTLSFYKIKHQSVLHLQAQIQIFAKLMTGKIITITAEASDTIAIIITKIASKTKFKSKNLKLKYAGKLLEDQKTLAFYGIKRESTIDIRRRLQAQIQIFPKLFTGKIITITTEASDTIANIITKIASKTYFKIKNLRLVYAGNHLEDTKTLSDYIVSTDSDRTIDVRVEGRMPISIKIPSMEKTLPLNVKYMGKVHKLKVMIEDEVGIPSDQQLLIFCGKTLEDDHLLIACGITKNSTVYVMLNPLAPIRIFVKIMTGKTITITVEAGDTISIIITKIASKIDFKCKNLKLMYAGKVLEDQKTLSFYGIKRESTVYLR
ncbi:Polyubiquitin [Dendrobium catenatum]|uniref:Polyubiquitin n=1 Tax=Dendrobium catenatum TaxID=906689 RepID=A0A2I0V7W5_9ASPA|nr:Polyubiquitin [Dendrobium catenatum]